MSDKDNDRWVDPQFKQSVRDTAYFLWENDGRPEGREQEYWFSALERCLRLREVEGRSGGQIDDNIDDLGRKLSDRGGKPMDQPIE